MKNQIYSQIEIRLGQLIDNHISFINVKDCILEIYGRYDFFVRRSFDAMYCNSKKKFPHYKFICQKGIITIKK